MNINNNLLKVLLSIILSIGMQSVFAQCGTIMVGPNQAIYPDTQTNLPIARYGLPYQAAIQIYAESGYTYTLNSIDGLPASFSYSKSPSNGQILQNTSGCYIIQSSFPIDTGTYPLILNITVSNGQFNFPFALTGYSLVCGGLNNGTELSGGYLFSNFTLKKVGTTLNNQQTNGSSYRRVQLMPSNKVGVTWTTSNDIDPFLGRGTGYNQFNGTSWIKSDTNSSRIETQRTGSPSYAFNAANNEEVILSHIVTSSGLSGGFVMSRKNINAPNWNESVVLDTIPSVPGLLWSRTTVANNFLHVVACYTDSSQSQPNRVVRNGVRTPVVYSRLNLNTNVWDIKTVTLPGYNSLRYYSGFNDSYSIDANGNNVAILIGSAGQDLSLWKSNNNGNSWMRTIIDTFYKSPFIEKSTLVDPPVITADRQLHVLLDNGGSSHCFWSQMAIINSDTTDGTWLFYPSNSHQQLMYWKEGTPIVNKKAIANFAGDPINNTNWQQYSGGRYGESFYLANPSAGISADGKIYCIYSSPTEGDYPIGMRDIYLTHTNDSGQTWSTPKNLTGVLGAGLEQAFPSIAKTVNQKIHFSYSQSTSVGPLTAGAWDINYSAIDTNLLDVSDTLYYNQNRSFSLSDTLLCNGQQLGYNIVNASIYFNGVLLNSGTTSGTITPASTGIILIKTMDGQQVIRSVNITVGDFLNLQPLFNGTPLASGQAKVCGLSKSYQWGVITNYTGAKNVVWKLNDTINLANRTNLVDTFTQAGKYTLTIKTPSGCSSTKELVVSKFNNVFNPDFTVNRQIITSPPFDVFFTNTTPAINDYKFYWSWGDGKQDSTDANLLVPKTFTNNGLYTIGLVAQNKQSGCRDSIIKVSFISCSGQSPQPLSATVTKSNPTCSGTLSGTLSITPTGGNAPYLYRINGGTYQSNNVFINLSAGIYNLEVKDASNAVFSKTDTLLNPQPIVVGAITGSNGVPAGSSQAYGIVPQTGAVYSWNIINGTLLSGNGTSNIIVQWAALAGLGKVISTVQIGSCHATDTLNISIGTNPLIVSSTKVTETCFGKGNGSIQVTAQGGTPPYAYSINNGLYQLSSNFINLKAGTYRIKVKDANQIMTELLDTLNSGVQLLAGVINGPVSVNVNSLHNYIINQQSGITYKWSALGGLIANGQNTNVAQLSWGAVPVSGNVSVVVTNSSGCSDTSTLKVQIGTVGISDLHKNSRLIAIYPNPTKQSLTIDFGNTKTQGHVNLLIYDILGRLVYDELLQEQSSDKYTISVSGLSTGNYVLTIQTEEGIEHVKFIKE